VLFYAANFRRTGKRIQDCHGRATAFAALTRLRFGESRCLVDGGSLLIVTLGRIGWQRG
jgi:hypothetical protein